jgi:hypothetical protein
MPRRVAVSSGLEERRFGRELPVYCCEENNVEEEIEGKSEGLTEGVVEDARCIIIVLSPMCIPLSPSQAWSVIWSSRYSKKAYPFDMVGFAVSITKWNDFSCPKVDTSSFTCSKLR